MGLIGKILITVACLLLSFFSLRLGRRKQEYESGVDTVEIEKRYTTKIIGHFCGFIFLLPLVSCWFPEWADAHNWNLTYAGFLFLVLILLVLPKMKDDEDKEEIKKKSNNHHDYNSAG